MSPIPNMAKTFNPDPFADAEEDAFVWRPPGPVAKAFMQDPSFVRGLKGPFGSGKSVAAILEILRVAALQPELKDGTKRHRVLVVRNTYDQLKTAVWKTWIEVVGDEIGEIHSSAPMSHRFMMRSVSPGCEFVEIEVVFISLDRPSDVRKLKGFDCTMAWLDEATELGEEVLHICTARVQRYPKARDEYPDNRVRRCVIMTTNPPSASHWWHRLAVRERPAEWAFFDQPSGTSAQAENLQNLVPGYYEIMARGKDKAWIDIFIHGNYGYLNTNKKVYPTWSDALHTGKWDREQLRESRYPLYLGVDFGLTPAVSFAYSLPMGKWRVDREIVTENCGALRLGQEIIRVLKAEYPWYWESQIYRITCDPAGEGRVQTDENTPLLVLQALGLRAFSASTNNPVTRREPIDGMLTRLVDGEPALQVHEGCITLLEGFGGAYHFKKLDISGDAQYGAEPVKNMSSHVHDSLQYLFNGAGEGSAILITDQRARYTGQNAMRTSPKKSIW